MPGELWQRGETMLRRVEQEAQFVAPPAGVHMITDALRHALVLRQARVVDDHDPRYLHPTRTVRILIADAGCSDVTALTAAACLESLDAELRCTPADAAAAALLDECPLPDPADTLLERLVSTPAPALLVTLAERLDHARHLHLRPALPWTAFHAQVVDVYLPVAVRANAMLGRRFDRWADAFTRRLTRQEDAD